MGDGDQVVRGRARVDPYAVPPVVGRAPVPGALSLPKQPRPRVIFPSAPGRVAWPSPPPPVPPLRAPAPVAAPADNPPPVREKTRLTAPAAAALVAALIVGGSYLVAAERMPRMSPSIGRWGAFVAGGATSRPPVDVFPTATRPSAGGAPTRLRVRQIGVDTPLEKLGLGDAGELRPPKAFARAGWYAEGTSPGDVGPAVIAGHVDSKSGPAVFYRLRELTAGDRIEVVRGGRTERFTVVRTRWYPKADFPTAEVYGPTPDRQLRLITCGGVFDRKLRSYRENLVVYAVAG